MTNRFLFRVIIYLTVPLLFMLYGMLVVKYHVPPYSLFKSMQAKFKPFVENKDKIYGETNVQELISIKRSSDVAEYRKKTIEFLWGQPRIPTSLPSSVVNNYEDNRYSDIASLDRIDKLTITMEFGLESNIYHFIPKEPNNKVVLYHQGHGGDFYNGKEQIEQFIQNGYTVVGLSMPLLGLNNQPEISSVKFGKLKLSTHEHIKLLSPERGHPIKYFIEPVVIVLNYLKNEYDYSSVSMVGISGGGWTATIAAAVDTRIKNSFHVAGSYPIYLRSNRDWGDYEQTVPELYNLVNYLDLYVLGSYGNNRKQLQIINMYDACCFAGTKWKTYKNIVQAHVSKLGSGQFDLFLDDSHHEHLISDNALDQIMDEL